MDFQKVVEAAAHASSRCQERLDLVERLSPMDVSDPSNLKAMFTSLSIDALATASTLELIVAILSDARNEGRL